MIGTGAAILGAGILGAGASMWGANKASDAQTNAANQAAAVQREGQANALAFQRDVYGRQTANYDAASGNLDPYIKNGAGASGLLGSFYGLNGSDPALGQNALERFRQSPDYQFGLKGGSDALDNSAAARGGVLGGNQIRAQTEFGQGLATQNLTNYLTRLSGMAGQGIQAGGALGQMGVNLGANAANTNASTNLVGSNNIAQSNMAAGTAEAAGIMGGVKGFNSGLNALTQYSQMNRSSYGGGGTGLSLSGTGGLY